MSDSATATPARRQRLVLTLPAPSGAREILSPEALDFLLELHERFAPRVRELLAARRDFQVALDAGRLPEFPPETADIRAADWRTAEIPRTLRDRRVEITGPPERKMVVNALNSGAKVFMADFEDSLTPTWRNLLDGQVNLRDAIRRQIDFTSPEGKRYELREDPAVLIVRPRGWHLPERHVLVDGEPMPGALFDFGLYFFHNARELLERGGGPYFYLPKLEHYPEAALWAEVFRFAEDWLKLPARSIKATVLIETLSAAFEMDEILYALREYVVGLNCGRWDYIFSYIKQFHRHARFMLPERGQVTMSTHFLHSYSQLLIKTCHRRGAFAMGGMAAQIPIKGDAAANRAALDKVRADKEREARDGHDGTWVAHPGLVPVAFEVFDRYLDGPNQLAVTRGDVNVDAADLLAVPEGGISLAGFRNNIGVALRYLAAWLNGQGCVPIHHLMEDAATAEIARAQLWQWLHHEARLDDGTPLTERLFRDALEAELAAAIRERPGLETYCTAAAGLLSEITRRPDFADFLTLPAYDAIIARGE